MTRYVCVYTHISQVAPELWCGYGVSTYVPMDTLTLTLRASSIDSRRGAAVTSVIKEYLARRFVAVLTPNAGTGMSHQASQRLC